MDVKTLTSKYLSAINDGVEALQTPDGFIVWMPTYYSDGDGVVLSVRRAAGGWMITDDGSTMSNLHTQGAAIESPTFAEAWRKLARPAGDFIPGDQGPEDGEITAWATDTSLGDALNLVALAAVRAEGLAFIREREGGERFATKIGKRIGFLLNSAELVDRGLTRGRSLTLQSGRSKRVTASIERNGSTLAVLQAVGGRDDTARERAFERCFTMFSRAQIDQERRYAVVESTEDWDSTVLADLREVGQVLAYRTQSDFDREFKRVVAVSLGRAVRA